MRFVPGVLRKRISKEETRRETNRVIVESQEKRLLKGVHRKKYNLTISRLSEHSPILAHPEYNYLAL